MKLTPLQKLIYAATFSFLTLGGGMGGLWLLSRSVTRTQASIQRIRNEILMLEEERRFARAVQSFLDKRGDDIAGLDKIFIDRERPVEFIETVENLARTTGNRLTIEFNEGVSTKTILSFRLTIEGAESSTKKYLELLELLPHIIKIENLSFQKYSDPTYSGEYARLLTKMTLIFTINTAL